MTIDIDHLRRWVGREDTAEEQLTRTLYDRFGATFDLPPQNASDAPAPPLIHFCLCNGVVSTSELGRDGHPKRGGFLPPVPLPQRMWARGEVTFHDDLSINATITRQSTVESVALKQGRTGPMVFVTIRHRINCEGKLAIDERQDIVYRETASRQAAGRNETQAKARADTHSKTVRISGALLFRYSALTFNAHRIHFDLPYTRYEEHYPDLVIHGPLQATLLCHYAAQLKGKTPRTFSFRCNAPLFAPADILLSNSESSDGMSLCAASEKGIPAMIAKATW